MKFTRLITLFCSLLVWGGLVRAQEPATAAWLVSNFDVTANLNAEARSVGLRAALSVRNVGRGNGATLTVRLAQKAEVKAVTVNDATASFRVSPEPRGNLLRATITLPVAAAPDSTVNVIIDYNLPVAKNEGAQMLSPLGSQFLPASAWFPAPNTIYAPRGMDVAPWRVTVNGLAAGETLLAPGKLTENRVETTLYGQPFFVTGNWDKTDAANARVYLFKGATAEEKARAQELLTLANAARDPIPRADRRRAVPSRTGRRADRR